MTRTLDVLVLFDIRDSWQPDPDFRPDPRDESWASERSVMSALRRLGHRVRALSLYNDVTPLIAEVRDHRPDVVFNLVDEFNRRSALERNVVALLELLQIPYTGCGSAGITLCKNKALAKKILVQNGIPTARFEVYQRGRRFRAPRDAAYPLFVKPASDDASYGISKASIVDTDATLARRVRYIHETLDQDAIAEEYIEGRELYVSVMGHRRLEVFPLRELKFRAVPQGEPHIATFQAKWNPGYRKKWGINEGFADPLPRGIEAEVMDLCRRAYRALQVDGYCRMDLRLTPEGRVVLLEANPNPFLAPQEDFAESAKKAGYPFETLLDRLVSLAIHRPAA